MSSVSLSELILLFVIGLLILGPERLPRVASQIGRWVGRARRTANQLRYQLEREVALAEFEEKKKEKAASRKTAAAASTPGASDTGAASATETAEPKPRNDAPGSGSA